MKRVLIVEDSSVVMRVIKHVMNQSDLIEPLYAESFAEAKAIIASEPTPLFAALVDLHLPDAPNGEVVDFTLAAQIPTIVFTGSFDNDKRKELLAKGVVDYVTKEGKYSYIYTKNLLHRLIKNEQFSVLVVDDSATGRRYIASLLQLHRYQVYEACDGVQGIKILLENPAIRLVITDYNMPRMDGCELVQNIRCKYEKSDLVVIGLSSEGEEALSAKFIKSGANDFLRKPFNHEEFFCRVSHNVELLEMIEAIRDSAHRDFYTGAYNRHYFFERGEVLLRQAREKNTPVAGVVIDIDDFRRINHTHGNDAGDAVMKAVAQKLMVLFDRFLVARADGQEFYALMVGLDNEKAVAFVEKLRQIFASLVIDVQGAPITVTFSAGVSSSVHGNLDSLIQAAGECLIRAKEAGGDLVFGDD